MRIRLLCVHIHLSRMRIRLSRMRYSPLAHANSPLVHANSPLVHANSPPAHTHTCHLQCCKRGEAQTYAQIMATMDAEKDTGVTSIVLPRITTQLTAEGSWPLKEMYAL